MEWGGAGREPKSIFELIIKKTGRLSFVLLLGALLNYTHKKVQAPHAYLYHREKVATKRKMSAIFLWNSKNLDNCLQVVNSLSRLQMVYGGSYNERPLSLLLHNFLILTPLPPPPAQACALRRWRQDQLIFSAESKRNAPSYRS